MGDRYGLSDINEISIGVSIWDVGYRYGIWANDMGDDRIDVVILRIDMGYLVTLATLPHVKQYEEEEEIVRWEPTHRSLTMR